MSQDLNTEQMMAERLRLLGQGCLLLRLSFLFSDAKAELILEVMEMFFSEVTSGIFLWFY